MTDEPNGVDVLDRAMESTAFTTSEVRSRLPATLAGPAKRVAVCAVRNPDASVDAIALTTGVDHRGVLDALKELVAARLPLTDDVSEVRVAFIDDLLDKGRTPASLGPDDFSAFAKAVSRRLGRTVNAKYLESSVTGDDIDGVWIARSLERLMDTRPLPGDVERFLDDHDLRSVLEAVGLDLPDENLDHVVEPVAEPDFDYVMPDESWTEADLEPGVKYGGTVNNVKGYGVFVSVIGYGPGDVSGLIHRSNMPALIQPTDFEVGDDVMVRVVERKPDGSLGFELAGVIDATRLDRVEFEPVAEYVEAEPAPVEPAPSPTEAAVPSTDSEPEPEPEPEPVPADLEPDTLDRREYAERKAVRSGYAGPAAMAKAACRNHGVTEGGELFCAYCGEGPFAYPFGLPGHLGYCEAYLATKAPDEPQPDDEPMTTQTTGEYSSPSDIPDDVLLTTTGPLPLADGRWMCPHINTAGGARCEKTFDQPHQVTGHMSAHTKRGSAKTKQPVRDDEGEVIRRLEGITEDTGEHEALTIIADLVDEGADHAEVGDVIRRMRSVQPQSTTPALLGLYRKKMVDRRPVENVAGSRSYVYWPTEQGRLELQSLGRHPSQGETLTEPTAAPTQPAPTPTPAPAQPAAVSSSLEGDVQMTVGMALGRGDVTADDAAATLRRIADRLEGGR